jgi:hypothetical protein
MAKYHEEGYEHQVHLGQELLHHTFPESYLH